MVWTSTEDKYWRLINGEAVREEEGGDHRMVPDAQTEVSTGFSWGQMGSDGGRWSVVSFTQTLIQCFNTESEHLPGRCGGRLHTAASGEHVETAPSFTRLSRMSNILETYGSVKHDSQATETLTSSFR